MKLQVSSVDHFSSAQRLPKNKRIPLNIFVDRLCAKPWHTNCFIIHELFFHLKNKIMSNENESLGNKIKDTIDDAGTAIKNTAKDVKTGAQNNARSADNEANKAANDAKGEAGNIFDKAGAKIKNAVGDVKTSSANAANNAENESEKAANNLNNEAKKADRDERDRNGY